MDAPRSLADWLRSRSDAQLAALLVARPDLAAPVPPDLGVLAARAGARLSVLRALEQLDAWHLALVDALVLGETPTTRDAVLSLAGGAGTPAQVDAGLEQLRELALLWNAGAGLHLVSAVREVAGATPAGLGRPVAAVLARHTDRQLAPLCKALGLPTDAGLPGVVAVLGDPRQLEELVSRAPAPAREVLASLADGPPYGQVRDAQRAIRVDEELSPVRWLIAHGLLVPVDPGTVELPREVGLLLRGDHPLGDVTATPPDLATTAPGAVSVDTAAAHAGADAIAKVEAVLEQWSTTPPPVLRTGGVGVREVRRLAKDLDLSERTTALLLEVAWAAGLLDQTADADPEWLPTPGYDTWAALPPEQRWTALALAWLDAGRLPGLVGERDARDKVLAPLSLEIARPGAGDDRRRLLAVVAEAPVGRAPVPESLREVLLHRGPRRGGRLRDRVVEWTLEEAAVLGITGRGGLSTAARHLLRDDTRGAATALADSLPAPVDHVLVQPDLTVVAPGPLERGLAAEMALVADVESTGGATVYRVSESSVRRALDAGRSAGELQELFRSRSRTPVPQTLSYLVEDVARRHGRLRVGSTSSYLRCDDEALLTEVLAHRRTAVLNLRRLAPTVLVCPAAVSQVLDVLRGAGYAPAAEAPDGALLLARPEARRAAARPRPRRVHADPTVLPPEQAALAVTALRAGDVAARAARRPPQGGGSYAQDVLGFLQTAAREGRQVWIGYVDAQGRSTSRIVEPLSVEGGFVRAHDHLRHEERTFSIHRVTGVSDLQAE